MKLIIALAFVFFSINHATDDYNTLITVVDLEQDRKITLTQFIKEIAAYSNKPNLTENEQFLAKQLKIYQINPKTNSDWIKISAQNILKEAALQKGKLFYFSMPATHYIFLDSQTEPGFQNQIWLHFYKKLQKN